MKKVIIAPAGSGKTTNLVEFIKTNPNRKNLVVTYTLNNLQEIKNKFYQLNKSIPKFTTIVSWFSFLLRDTVRPYQNYVYEKRINSIAFVEGFSTMYVSKDNFEKYYLSKDGHVYTDKISELGIICNEKSKGLVINRLESLYDHIFIDEIQDMAGYDLEFLEYLLKSKIDITLIGDHRQATYTTNSSGKNKKYSGIKIIEKFLIWEKEGKCKIEYLDISYRCNQLICDFADSLFPDFPKTSSENKHITGHDGLFIVRSQDALKYIEKYSPKILRYNIKSSCLGFDKEALKGMSQI